jgi:mono/diheme cytochrome c family protein
VFFIRDEGGGSVQMNVIGWSIVAVLASSGCGGSGPSHGASAASSGGELAQYQGPITSTEVDRGKELFATYCDDCHPGGESDVGPSLIDKPHTPPQIRKQIREGSGKMKPFPEKRVSNEDMEAVLAFLASINAVK